MNSGDVLTNRALNRATLARQLLLDRSDLPLLDAVEHLVGLQAQNPLDPYTALWSRLRSFDPAALGQAMLDREVVRIVVLRGTIHLVTAADCLGIRALCQPVLDGEMARHSEHAAHLRDLDLTDVLVFGRRFLNEPRTGPQLKAALTAEFPALDAPALALALRNRLALVQVPPRGVWGRTSQVTLATAEAWLGRDVDPAPSTDALLLRYLAAFGPATVADAATWSRLTGLREPFERLRPQLVTFRDEKGRELFDLPDAPRPDPDVPVPPRFLPEYDNCLLSHADRSRFDVSAGSTLTWPTRPPRGTVLCDGPVTATWHLDGTTLQVRHRPDLTKSARRAIEREGHGLLSLLAPGAAGDVVFLAEP